MDVFQVIVGVPQSIEVIVKCIRVLESYRNIDKHYFDDLTNVLEVANHLNDLESVPGNVSLRDQAEMTRSYNAAVIAIGVELDVESETGDITRIKSELEEKTVVAEESSEKEGFDTTSLQVEKRTVLHERRMDSSEKARIRDSPQSLFVPTAIPSFSNDILKPIDADLATSLFVVTEGDYKGYIVDRRVDTKRIARLLVVEPRENDGASNMTMGILRCCGYVSSSRDTNDLVLAPPLKAFHSRPRTLRRLLVTPGTGQHDLDARLTFAVTLATSVFILHSLAIVHKCIRPETILILDPEHCTDISITRSSSSMLGTPFLAGFINARSNYSPTDRNTFDDQGITQKLYHHPRQPIRSPGGGRLIAYQMEDDIYSLGICLLEIGLWKSLFSWNENRKLFVQDPQVCNLHDDLYKNGNGGIRDDVWEQRRKTLISTSQKRSERQDIERAKCGENNDSNYVNDRASATLLLKTSSVSTSQASRGRAMATTTKSTESMAKTRQQAFFDWLKPRRGVAIARLKNNGFAMIVALLVTQLFPLVPSPLTSLWMAITGGRDMDSWTRWLCWIELALFSVMSANILQAYIGIRYPPPPCKPIESPSKRTQLRSPPPPRPLKTFTPTSSQRRTHFSSTYLPSPLSTPSRIINYKSPFTTSSPSPSPFFGSLNSSTLSSSSPLMSSPLAYRGRQSYSQSVRSLDGSLLNQLDADDDDDY
ncbi:hypothetical protein EW145_g5071 [Phellinidium pouzarii]|uniref:Protein kinase domain-containing protein n=1 Tax=Phellinidium pouzarii TaxID=167371 RepID=A0A4S4L2P5_9AGAM|nr:hypothetical protein EW145_g5071 [Phellinidium pouzarii]